MRRKTKKNTRGPQLRTLTWSILLSSKTLSGKGSSASSAQSIGLQPGFYQTDINIHNPSFQNTNATIVKKFVLAQPEVFDQPLPIIQVVPAVPSPYVLRWAILKPDAAMRLDCKSEILPMLFGHGSNVSVAKGFVVIYSDVGNLDVWTEYTSLGATTGSTPAVEIVLIDPKPFTP